MLTGRLWHHLTKHDPDGGFLPVINDFECLGNLQDQINIK